jgi:hypothetical protein
MARQSSSPVGEIDGKYDEKIASGKLTYDQLKIVRGILVNDKKNWESLRKEFLAEEFYKR